MMCFCQVIGGNLKDKSDIAVGKQEEDKEGVEDDDEKQNNSINHMLFM